MRWKIRKGKQNGRNRKKTNTSKRSVSFSFSLRNPLKQVIPTFLLKFNKSSTFLRQINKKQTTKNKNVFREKKRTKKTKDDQKRRSNFFPYFCSEIQEEGNIEKK